MDKKLADDWSSIVSAFALETSLEEVRSIHSGHINDSYLLQDKNVGWILQRVNHFVFPEPFKVQHNFDVVARHLEQKSISLENLTTKRNDSGQSLVRINHDYWRLIKEIRGAKTLQTATSTDDAYHAAFGIGEFDSALADLPVNQIHSVIQGFHDLEFRLEQLHQSIKTNHKDRLKFCAKELAFAEQYDYLANWIPKALSQNLLQTRVTHNDTKISNVLLDNLTGKAKAVIDWDTIMPGIWMLDYGDMVRSFTPNHKEDSIEEDTEIRWQILQALTDGYLAACSENLSEFEKEHLLIGAMIIIYMVGVRFLTDYLNGDVYFKTQRENQNLDRCRNQFQLLKQLDSNYKNWQQQLKLI